MQGDEGWRVGLAIAFALLMVTAVVAPIGVAAAPGNGNGPPGNPGGGPSDDPGNGNGPPTATPTPGGTTPTPGGNATATQSRAPLPADAVPVLEQYRAVQIVGNLSANGNPGTESHIERAHDRFNTSLQYFSGPVRVNESAAFTNDAVGIRALANLANRDVNVTDARRAADLVYQADNESVSTTVADARRVVDRYGPQMDNQGLAISAERHVENAERTLERGQGVGDADGRRYFQERAQALTQVRTAHQQARLAMRFVDRETSPSVSIANDQDPVWDGNGTRPVVVQGTISTVRPSTISNVTVTVNDETAVPANSTLAAAEPGANATYRAQVNLTERVNRITVTVTDGASDGGNQPGQQETAVLRVDGDGLPESYETETVGTDPLDPDSDSDVTSADESDNGTIDGREDFDGDRLTTIEELELGTDPHDADTDDDRLTDWEEVAVAQMDPLNPDSGSEYTDANESDNGVEDGAEDLDGDGLTNAQEFANGSSPLYADTDADGLDDPAELANGTDPNALDTDDDGLRDSLELVEPFDTDPLNPDTDGDGVLDGNESYTTTTGNDSLGATVSLTGPGNVAAHTTVDSPNHVRHSGEYAPTSVSVSEVVHVDVDTNFSSANVTLAYEESAIQSNESSLGVYRFNESSGGYERLPSTIDATNDTITARTDEFSPVVAFDVPAAQQVVSQRIVQPPGGGGTSGTTTVASFDFETSSPTTIDSGSSATVNGAEWRCRNDPRGGQYSDTPISGECVIEDGRAVVREETNRMRYLEHDVTLPSVGQDEALFVESSIEATIESEWSNSALSMVVQNGSGTEVDVFRIEQDYGGGTHTVTASPRMEVTDMAGEEVTISIRADGRWTYQQQNTMAEMAVDDLTIERRGDASVDSDGDGISDAWESGGVPLANTTRTVQLDPHDADTDGDGLEDGEEVNMDVFHADQDLSDDDVIHFPGFAWSSDPTSGNTDGDRLDDSIERNGWDVQVVNTSNGPNPYRFDRQCERTGVQNGQIQWDNCEAPGEDIRVDSSPLSSDTDGDGLTDYQEYNATYTDPNATRTYGITRNHGELIEAISEVDPARFLRKLDIPTRYHSQDDVELTDASDSFDFVLTDDAQTRDRFVFTALDGQPRTDQWLSTSEELTYGTGPWDPDTDDDGLTDGQELFDITKDRYHYLQDQESITFNTDPLQEDHDGDGYWDGWYGVYGVGRSDNVILYRENLQSGDGIEGDEIVSEQAGYHNLSEAPMDHGADVDGDHVTEHSNLHIGELHWRSVDPSVEGNPTNENVTPEPSLRVEVDWHENVSQVFRSAVEDTEETFALYDIDVTFEFDQELENDDLYIGTGRGANVPLVPPTSLYEAERTQDVYHNETDDSVYLFLTPSGANGIGELDWSNKGGVASSAGGGYPPGQNFGIVVFEDDKDATAPVWSLQKATAHETAHLLGAGRADDGLVPETYSGNDGDNTPERVTLIAPSTNHQYTTARWSLMMAGFNPNAIENPAGTRVEYMKISLEEAFTIETNNVLAETH